MSGKDVLPLYLGVENILRFEPHGNQRRDNRARRSPGNPDELELQLIGCRIGAHMGNPFGAASFKDGKNGVRAGTNFRHILFRLSQIQFSHCTSVEDLRQDRDRARANSYPVKNGLTTRS
jgi:hypothetical protein